MSTADWLRSAYRHRFRASAAIPSRIRPPGAGTGVAPPDGGVDDAETMAGGVGERLQRIGRGSIWISNPTWVMMLTSVIALSSLAAGLSFNTSTVQVGDSTPSGPSWLV